MERWESGLFIVFWIAGHWIVGFLIYQTGKIQGWKKGFVEGEAVWRAQNRQIHREYLRMKSLAMGRLEEKPRPEEGEEWKTGEQPYWRNE